MNPNEMETLDFAPPKPATRRMSFFERYLSVWVALCMAAGILLGKLIPSLTRATAIALFGPESGAALATVVGGLGGSFRHAISLCGV